jgi:MFS family permease
MKKPVGYAELIKANRNYRNLWFGQIVSEGGDWFNLIASSSLISIFTNSGLAIGFLFVLRTLAPFLASPIGGVLADRFDRKKIIVLTSLLRAFVLSAFLLVQTKEDLWLIYLLTFLQLFISGLFFPARTAIIPDLVSKESIGTATAIMGMTFSAMLAIGSALGGFVAGFIGIEAAFVLNALAYLSSAFLLQKITYVPREIPDSAVEKPHLFNDFLEGVQYIKQRKHLWPILPHKALVGMLLGSTFEVLLVAISEKQILNDMVPSVSLGTMFFVTGIGLTSSILIVRLWALDDIARVCWSMVFGYVIGAFGLWLVSLLGSYEIVLVGNFLRGAGNSLIYIFSIQLVLMITPDTVRGRFVSLEFAVGMLGTSTASLLVGWLLDDGVGIQQIAQSMSLLTFIPAILWAGWLLLAKSVRVYKTLVATSGEAEYE